MTGWLGKAARAALLAVCLWALPSDPALAQQTDVPAEDAAPALGSSADALASSLNYDSWQAMAERAEGAIEDRAGIARSLADIRTQLVDWREAFTVAQNANSTRIATLRAQIAALGPVPDQGEIEAPEIAARRTELAEQLVHLQAPSIAADEAYSRADGLIREIDRLLREQQADELLRLLPAPVNPANWPAAARVLTQSASKLWTETFDQIALPEARTEFSNNIPLILLFLTVAVVLLWRGRVWIDALAIRLQGRASVRGRQIWGLFASLGQIIIPTLGVLAFTLALQLTGLLGPLGTAIVESLPDIGLSFFAGLWLGGQVFPVVDRLDPALRLSDGSRSKGRLAAALFGLTLGLEQLRAAVLEGLDPNSAASAVLDFPILLLGGLLLLRIGHLLKKHRPEPVLEDAQPGFRNHIIGLLGRAAVIIGFLGPALAAVGYVAAGKALVFPAGLSLALVAFLFILHRLIDDLFSLWSRGEDLGKAALLPVLISSAITIASLPVFALVWGVRTDDLTELWTRFREGFQMGSTRVSPMDFVFFAIIFGIGYMLTRLFQGALKSNILPKTSLDQGGQNAISVGVGYAGIFLAGLVAIKSTGIDLSGLAIIAGALSLGIGFGLQNIVSNFVSGIILLIERPVSEGDWIEVGTVQGIVKSISVRSTRIQTFDRSDVIVPNLDFVTGRVTNWTRFNLTGRLTIPVGVEFGSDTRVVERILREIAEVQPLAVMNPPPVIAFMGFGGDSMNFEMRVVLRDINFSVDARTEINHQIVERFAAAGIGFAHASREFTMKLAAEKTALQSQSTPEPADGDTALRPQRDVQE